MVVQQLDSPTPNPCLSPRASRVVELREPRPDYVFWRAFMALHLAVVVATVAFMASQEGRNLPHQVAPLIQAIAVYGVVLIPGAPFFITYLIVAGCKHEKRYLIAAAVETLLWMTQIFAMFPAIQ